MTKLTLAERFWSYVDQSGGPNACWLWLGAIQKGREYGPGYGLAWDGTRSRGAHVVAFELHTSEQANGRFCLHRCDNPSCCNPAHLFWGTHQDNMDDMVAKGRRTIVCGEAHGAVKLTEKQVKLAHQRYIPYSKEHGVTVLAREFGVGAAHMSDVLHGKRWKRQSPGPRVSRKLIKEQVEEIRARYVPNSRDASTTVLAREFGVSQAHLSKVVLGQCHGEL